MFVSGSATLFNGSWAIYVFLLKEGRKVHFATSHEETEGKKAKHPR